MPEIGVILGRSMNPYLEQLGQTLRMERKKRSLTRAMLVLVRGCLDRISLK